MPEDIKPGTTQKITIQKNGPYLVTGFVPLFETHIENRRGLNEYHKVKEYPRVEQYKLCRCGHTSTPPFCDGSHSTTAFNGTETAQRRPYMQRAREQRGPALILMDDNRCALARFCHKEHGDAWELTEKSDNTRLREEAIQAACDCPSGRLVAIDELGNAIEPDFEPSIEILQDIAYGVSAPIFVKGYIPIESADGFVYERRNRVTLCRCGKSRNKPFCDATHVDIGYKDRK